MVRKDPNPRSGDLGINIQGVPREFLFLIWILNVIGLTPPLHILKLLVQNNLED